MAVSVNQDGTFGVLSGFDDWANLKFDFQNTGDFDDGEHSFSTRVVEVDFITHLQIPEDIEIDIRPGNDINPINPRSQGTILVALLSTDGFDAPTQVDQSSLTFGRTGVEPSLAFCNTTPQDVNGDGLLDLVCHFRTQTAAFQAGSTQGVLRGETVEGAAITGTDSVLIVP